MPLLGFDASKKDIDELFNSWDKDGGGSLDFKELQKILRPPAASGVSKLKSAANAMKAVARREE